MSTEEHSIKLTSSMNKQKAPIKKSRTQWLKNDLVGYATVDSVPINFGERLYRKSLALDHKKSKELNKVKIKDDKTFHHQCSFKPKTNPSSSCTSSFYQSNTQRFDTISTFNNYNKSGMRMTTLNTKEQNDLDEIRKYAHKPLPIEHIEDMSNRLYNEQKVIERKKADLTAKVYNDLYPFTPKVNDDTKPDVQNFFVRLQNWVDSRNYKIQEMNNTLPIDPKTNQLLFTPMINDIPTSIREEEVHHILHNENRRKKERLEQIREEFDKEIIEKANMPKVSINSEKIVEKQKQRAFNALYDFINMENSDVIKYSPMISEKLRLFFTTEFIKEFDTLLIELKESDETLNRIEFINAMNELYVGMTLNTKREIMTFDQK